MIRSSVFVLILRNSWVSVFAFLFVFNASAQSKNLVVFEGKIPGQYIENSNNHSFVYGAVVIDKSTRLIESIETEVAKIRELRAQPGVQFISLKRKGKFDAIYPGLIDLHNHTKQNSIGVWKEAKGQFANRYEWRNFPSYTKSVSGNINPWISYSSATLCAAYRHSEVQAMVVGTTYLQGPSSCVENFAISRVEDPSSYVSAKGRISAPMELVQPDDMVFVWNTLAPIIRKIQRSTDSQSRSHYLAYETALAQVINKYCDFSHLDGVVINSETVRGSAISTLKNKSLLTDSCQKEDLPNKFIRYVSWRHHQVNSKKLYAESIARGEGAAIIAHLSEGRRDDYYNQREFELVQLLGLDQKHVNFVHGVGISEAGLKVMGEKQMGLVWSPFSNHLLYNQTLDILKATKHKVLLAIGSDWLPTGSKGPLEEVKLARNYILKRGLADQLKANLQVSSVEEALYQMVTENPAKMINHWQNGADDSRWQNGENQGGIGTLAKNAMGTIIVTSIHSNDPYKNLIIDVWERDINLVVVDGKVQYGNASYLAQAGLSGQFEKLPLGEHDLEKLQERTDIPILEGSPDRAEKMNHAEVIGRKVMEKSEVIASEDNCKFEEQKGFAYQNSGTEEVLAYYMATSMEEALGLNLDRFRDIQRLIGVGLITQSRNRNDKKKGDPDYAINDFSPLYTCNDEYHYKRLTGFINPNPNDRTDEVSVNELARDTRINDQNLGRKPLKMQEKYPPHTH